MVFVLVLRFFHLTMALPPPPGLPQRPQTRTEVYAIPKISDNIQDLPPDLGRRDGTLLFHNAVINLMVVFVRAKLFTQLYDLEVSLSRAL